MTVYLAIMYVAVLADRSYFDAKLVTFHNKHMYNAEKALRSGTNAFLADTKAFRCQNKEIESVVMCTAFIKKANDLLTKVVAFEPLLRNIETTYFSNQMILTINNCQCLYIDYQSIPKTTLTGLWSEA